MSPRGIFTHVGIILHILDCLGQDMQVFHLGRAPRTKETLPDFLKWRRVTRPPFVFRRLTGSQRTPGIWGVTPRVRKRKPGLGPFNMVSEAKVLKMFWCFEKSPRPKMI